MLYKVLDTGGSAFHGGNGKWYLPNDSEPGEWMPPIEGELVACENGYHLCEEEHLLKWLGPAIYEAGCRGERLDCDDKVVVREARLLRKFETWNECSARLFACDCAERVLSIYEKQYSDDRRPREAIETSRRYVNGEATKEELVAARVAAGVAAWDAEYKWQTRRLMEYLNGTV